MHTIVPQITDVAPDAYHMYITNPVDIVTYAALKISGLPRNRVFGSGTVLDTSRLRYLVSRYTGVAIKNIHAYVAGEHGDSEVALWSSAEIGNVPLRHWGLTVDGQLFDAELREDIAKEVVNSAYRIIDGKGATNYAIGLAGRTSRPLSYVTKTACSLFHRCLKTGTASPMSSWRTPTLVDRNGAGRVLEPPLTLHERDGLTASAEQLRSVARDLGL